MFKGVDEKRLIILARRALRCFVTKLRTAFAMKPWLAILIGEAGVNEAN